MTQAAVNNHLHVVKWLHKHRKGGCTKRAMDGVVSLEMVEWLHTHRTAGCTSAAMNSAAAKGDFDILLFLHANRTEGCTLKALENAYANGHVVIFDWLVATYPDIISIDNFSLSFKVDPRFTSQLLDQSELTRLRLVRNPKYFGH